MADSSARGWDGGIITDKNSKLMAYAESACSVFEDEGGFIFLILASLLLEFLERKE